jgi:hypothetical protein
VAASSIENYAQMLTIAYPEDPREKLFNRNSQFFTKYNNDTNLCVHGYITSALTTS